MRPSSRRTGWLLALLTSACSSRSGAPATAGDGGVDAGGDTVDAAPMPVPCPAGLQTASDGQGCVEIAASSSCPAGSGPFLGSTTCQPVGWTGACPAGMKPDPAGWGCIDISPAAACSNAGGTTEKLGQTACVPVGDCTATFPPAAATLFVSQAYTASQLDATHFQTVSTAIAKATAGAVIAIDAGMYVEDVQVLVPLTLAGRCPSMVSLVNPGDTNAGVFVSAAAGVAVSGLTLQGHQIGVYVAAGGSVSVTDSILLANRGMGIYVTDMGSTASATRVRIAGSVPRAAGTGDGWGVGTASGGSVVVTDSAIIGNTHVGVGLQNGGTGAVTGTLIAWQVPDPDGDFGQGIAVTGGATLTLTDSAVVDSHSDAVSIQDQGSSGMLTGSVLRGTMLDANGFGHGLTVASNATASATNCLIAETGTASVLAAAGGVATIASSVVRGPLPARAGTWGLGVLAEEGGRADVTNTAIVGTSTSALAAIDTGSSASATGSLLLGTVIAPGVAFVTGAAAQGGATMTLTSSTVLDSMSLGVAAGTDLGGAKVTMQGTLVRGTLPAPQTDIGYGVQVVNGGTAVMKGSAVVENVSVGVVVGASGCTATLEDSVIRANALDPTGMFGYGLVASGDAVVTLQGSFVREHPGIALTFSASQGIIGGSWIAANAIGIQAQDGSYLTIGDDDAGTPDAGNVIVSSDTQFTSNGSRVGSGAVPLPPVAFGDGGVGSSN